MNPHFLVTIKNYFFNQLGGSRPSTGQIGQRWRHNPLRFRKLGRGIRHVPLDRIHQFAVKQQVRLHNDSPVPLTANHGQMLVQQRASHCQEGNFDFYTL